MGEKTFKTIFVMALLMIALAVQAFALPDNPPTCSLSANTNSAETTAVLTATSVDTLANAGVESVRIYEDYSEISNKWCGYPTTCVSVKTVTHTAQGSHSYYAVCRDKAGQQTTSGTVYVSFKGMNQPPVINSKTPTSPVTMNEGETKQFSITASDPDSDLLSYTWTVNGQVVSSGSNKYDFTKSAAGVSEVFTVAVQVSDGKGGFDTTAWQVTVMDKTPSVVMAKTAGLTECDTFTFQATATSYDSISTYAWDFGDGTSQNGGATIAHNFPENGIYTVKVTVTDSDGDTASHQITVSVTDVSPVVDAGPDDTVLEGTIAYFSGSASMLCSADTIQNYTWDFGDSTPKQSGQVLAQTSHNYTSDGSYTVTLKVCDEDSCTSDTLQLTVEDAVPAAGFTWVPQNPVEGQQINFTDTSSSYDPIVGWDWDFNNDSFADSTAQNPSWNFNLEGTYPVCFTVTDSDGDTDTHCTDITVGNNVPVVQLIANTTSGNEPLSVRFDCSVTGGNGPFTYNVVFGNGFSSSAAVDSTVYQTNGTYTAMCEVTDVDGDKASDTETINVLNVAPNTVLLLNATSGTEPLSVSATCSVTTGNAPLSYEIAWGDGSKDSTSTATHTYVQNGTYEVNCTITDNDGDAVVDSEVVTVFDSVPTVDFTWSPAQPVEKNSVSFTSNVTAYDTPVVYEWDFNDGSAKSTSANPSHTYAKGGDFNIILTVTDNDGSVVSVTKTMHVASNPPQVDLYVDPLSGTEPFAVNVTCVSIGGDAPLTFDIDFGDGSAHSASNKTTHTFLQNGTYIINCTVTDKDGDKGSDFESVSVADTVPTVNFTYSPAKPQEGQTVSFDATIVAHDTPVSVSWDFGDGGSSILEDPLHVYVNQGTYTVTVTVTDSDGSTASYTDTVAVGINAADVSLTVTPKSGDEPLFVDFVCAATGGNMPYTFDLDFGDGSAHYTATGVSVILPQHNYTQNGTYTVNCTVTDADSDVSFNSTTIVVNDTVPDVSFTFTPASPKEDHVVEFNATMSAYDAPFTWQWDFGDGNTSTDEDSKHTFALEAGYNVTLTVTDSDGSVTVSWAVVQVANNVPFVNLEAAPQNNVSEGQNVSFNCTVTGGNAPLSFVMDFGDGSSGTSQLSNHSYSAPGQYVATCTVTDIDGDTDSDFVIINVANNVPVVSLTAVPSSGPEGTSVAFTCDITGGDAPLNITLDFGDGSTTNVTSATHTYVLAGSYNATCTVTDADSDVGSDSETITITNFAPVVNLVVNATSGFEPLSINYTCEVGGGNAPFSYVVTFGDGASSTAQNGTHDYTLPGNYTITCQVVDADSDTDSDWLDIEVKNNAPAVILTALPNVGPEGTTVDFTCSVSGGNAPLSYVLDFADGSAAVTTSTAKHNYTNQGVYNATCTVTDADLDVGVGSALVNITNNAPVVNLALNVSSGFEPLSMNYTCTVGSGNAPFSYVVDFGDGSATSSSATGSHDYPNPGNYTVTCTVTDADSDTGMDVEALEVKNNAPVVTLQAIPNPVLEGGPVEFNCSVSGGNAPLSYVLDFGDGSSTTSSVVKHNYTLEGNYTAVCTVTDADADVGTANQTIVVQNNAPIVNLALNTTSGFEYYTSVSYNCTVGSGNPPFGFVVDFGDGSATSTASIGTHDYGAPGNYTMTCTVTDVDGDVGNDADHVHVLDNPPVVTLYAVPTDGLEGMTVEFNCSVSGGNAPLSYVLDFGDGSSTTSLVIRHNYTLEGVYNATCTVQDFDMDTDVDSVIINVSNNPPVVNLATNVTSGLEYYTSVNYTCSVGGGNAPLTMVVDFGNGSPTTSVAKGSHNYSAPGNYTLSCTVSDVDSDTDTDTVNIEVLNNPPIVDLTYTYSGLLTEGVNVTFNCGVTGGNSPFSYLLDFGDGSSVASSVASHVYSLEGAYNATCTVTDNDGDVGSDWVLMNVSNNVPVVNLLTNVSAGTEPLDVYFNCTLIGGGNAPFTYSIDFGDGSALVAASTASHTYAQNRSLAYNASCTITDTDSDVSVPDSEFITVYDSEPVTNFTWSPASPKEGDLVQFTDATTSYDGVVSWSWDLGDGNTSASQNPSHTYYIEGSYIVTLTTTDADGSATSRVKLVNVSNYAPVANLSVSPLSGAEPHSVMAICSAAGGNSPVSYSILWGDGTTSAVPTATHTYTQDGSYPVTCLVTDTDGDSDSDVVLVTVNDTEPTADFSWTPLSPAAGQNVTFTDLSTGYDNITAWAWDFQNDGIVDSTVQNPSRIFVSPSLYIVNLTVTDSDGSTDSVIKSLAVNVSVGAPIIFSVQATGITNTTANVTWGTDQGADSLVEYGTTTALGSSVSSAVILFNHNVPVTGLAPNTTYYYNVTSCNMFATCTTAGPYNFTTLANAAPDTTAPVVVLQSPADASTDADGNVTVQYMVTDNAALTMSCDIYSNTSGSWQADLAGQSTGNASSNTHSYSALADGDYEWNVLCSDGINSASASANFIFTVNTTVVDVTAPVVTLQSPADAGTDADGNVTVQYMVTDDMASGMSCDIYSNTSGSWVADLSGQTTGNASSNTHSYSALADGTYRWNVQCSDGTNSAFAAANFTFVVNTTVVDVTAPVVVLQSPADAGTDADGNVTVQYMVTDDMASGMSCDVFSNTSGSWQADLSGQSTGNASSNTLAYTGIVNGTYAWNVRCSDGTNSAFAPTNFTFVVSISAPPVPSGQTILNSTVYGGFYPMNFTTEVTETSVSGDTYMLNATVQGSPVVSIVSANLSYAILTNVSQIQNCTVIGTPTNFSVLSDSPCVNVYIDPSDVVNSDTTGSSVRNSNISDSTATNSDISDSTILSSTFDYCTISNSYLDGVVGFQCTISWSTVSGSNITNSTVDSGSTVTNSTVENGSTVTNSTVDDSDLDNSDVDDSTIDDSNLTDSSVSDSTITDSTLINATVTNSTVHNSTLIDVIVEDANITDGMICSGTVHDSFSFTANGTCVNLTDVINYPPVAVISASATSGTDSLAVDFSGSGSTDLNIPGLLNDSLTFSWDWDASNGITADATGVNASSTFGVGTFTVTLTVTDKFGKSDTETVTISVTSSGGGSTSSGGGGGGSGGGRVGQTFILTLTAQEPVKSLWLKSGDTVRYSYQGTDYSFLFRYVYSDKAKMGVSTASNYKEYALDENKKYNLNLDDSSESDLGVLPTNLNLGAGNFTFELLNVPEIKKPLVLPLGSKKKTVTPVNETTSSAELASDLAVGEPDEEEAFSEGVLEFIESLTLRKSAPLWAGLAVSLIIILVGLGLFWLVTRKE